MKISFLNERRQYKPSFSAGLTQSIAKEIQNADPILISQKLLKKGIPTNFDNNQTIAWCCNKVVEVIEHINKKYKMNFSLPKGIYVTDFKK